MAETTRKTGDEPAEGVDPGGTRPTRAGRTATPHVESGDRNTMRKENPATERHGEEGASNDKP